MPSQESNVTTDHEQIRRWVEERGGIPATVEGTESADEAGILRIDFPGRGEDAKLKHISWDEFFEKFDDAGLAFLYQDTTADGDTSRFSKFIRNEEGRGTAGRGQKSGGGRSGGKGRDAGTGRGRKGGRGRSS
jgi:hypothetical protein